MLGLVKNGVCAKYLTFLSLSLSHFSLALSATLQQLVITHIMPQ